MIIDLDKVWPTNRRGIAKIRIGFLNDSYYDSDQEDRVREVAQQWEDECENISLVWANRPKKKFENRDVRISFKPSSGGQWVSKVGTDATEVKDQSERTMTLEWTDNKQKMRRHILHEFGHMLGAEHEQFSPDFPWEFKYQAVVDHFREEVQSENDKRPAPKQWTAAKVKEKGASRAYQDMLKRLVQTNLEYSRFDESSIMLYTIERDWLKDNSWAGGPAPQSIKESHHLSYLDIRTMNKVYDGTRNDDSESFSSSDSEYSTDDY
ncbi:hypothetical protein CNMCM5793_001546 [Aspergillus hiratsukae]|uniref:Peptidase metallopeptidase domain-containing protein n=1 Tax=Aspergillus hiratsukae TaxID=1194566 RepID=A0A8H6UX22_9EURO|nr:hypothetical protein CNMCM5793_001546 [Aspergillus hiratsukae]KAF7167354.1 hypothetical protein CNMCM6106_002929 [Aspergillus hiratsukae]